MKRILFALIIVILMVSCSSTKSVYEVADEIVAESNAEKVEVKIRGKYGIVRPNWIIQDLTTENTIFGVGYANFNTEDDSRKVAKIEAKNELAEKILTFVRETASTSKTEASNSYEISSVQTSQAFLSGAVVEDEWVSSEGTVYILMSIPTEYVASQMSFNREDLDEYVQTFLAKTKEI